MSADPGMRTISSSIPEKFGFPRTVAMLVGSVAVAKLVLHLATDGRYGYFRDELYYIACSRHLDWGYVDQPPLIALVTWLELHVGGTSLHALRLMPAIAGTTLVVLVAFLARELGATRFGIWFASLATACIGISFVMSYLLTMNAFEPLFWTGCAYIVVRIINTGNQQLWLWYGVLAGIGLENKYSMAIFTFGMLVGLLLTPERKAFAPALDLDWRRRCPFPLLAKFDLERAASLAICGTDAQHQGERARRGFGRNALPG